MSVTLDSVVPWGRSLDEYSKMFNLPSDIHEIKIASLADGPASFNAEVTRLGGDVVSIDPIYCLTIDEIKDAFEKSAETVIGQVKATPDNWTWSYHSCPDGLLRAREKVLDEFLSDFVTGIDQGRYIEGSLPDTGLEESSCDLALCSHFLFLYSEHFDYDFHIASIREMCRLADDVRVFPILTLKQDISPYLYPIMNELREDGYMCSIEKVDYELQKGGNEMLKITKVNKSV